MSSPNRCAACGHANGPDARVCEHCRRELSSRSASAAAANHTLFGAPAPLPSSTFAAADSRQTVAGGPSPFHSGEHSTRGVDDIGSASAGEPAPRAGAVATPVDARQTRLGVPSPSGEHSVAGFGSGTRTLLDPTVPVHDPSPVVDHNATLAGIPSPLATGPHAWAAGADITSTIAGGPSPLTTGQHVPTAAADIGSTIAGGPSPLTTADDTPPAAADIRSTIAGGPSPLTMGERTHPGETDIRSTIAGGPSPFRTGEHATPGGGDIESTPTGSRSSTHEAAPTARSGEGPTSTLFGGPSPLAAGGTAEQSSSGRAAPAIGIGSTQIGMPRPDFTQMRRDDLAAKAAAPGPVGARPSPQSGSDPNAAAGGLGRTMIGLPRPSTDQGLATDSIDAGDPVGRTMLGGPSPAVAVERAKPAAAAPADDVAGRTHIFGSLGPADIAAAAPVTGPAGTEAAAARYAAAIASEENVVSHRRVRRALFALVIVGLLGAAAFVVALREQQAFKAEIASELSVRRAEGVYRIAVAVRASSPARLEHPGGTTEIGAGSDGSEWVVGQLEFTMPESELRVGDNTIQIIARPDDDETDSQSLTLQIKVYYRLGDLPESPPPPGEPVMFDVETIRGWKLSVPDAVVVSVGERFRVSLPPERFDGAKAPLHDGAALVTVALTLTGPAGETQSFTESLRVPVSETPLEIIAPPYMLRTEAAKVVIRGRTSPGARVTVGDVTTESDERGHFALTVPLTTDGRHELMVEARAAGRRPAGSSAVVHRVTADEHKSTLRRARKAARAFVAGAPRTPKYLRLLNGSAELEGRKVRIAGRVIAARRGPVDGRNEIQMVTCKTGDGCPIWVEMTGPVHVAPDVEAQVFGTLRGTRAYQSRGGETVTVPIVEGRFLLP